MAKDGSKSKTQDESEKNKRHAKPPASEWIVAAIGCVLVAGAIGFMIYQAIYHQTSPPNFSVKVVSVSQTANGYLVKFSLENTGDQTAAAVTVEGELLRDTESVEKSAATLTYAPSHSKREGGLFFVNNPQDFNLKIRATGYEQP